MCVCVYLCTCVCRSPAWPQVGPLQSGTGSEAASAGSVGHGFNLASSKAMVQQEERAEFLSLPLLLVCRGVQSLGVHLCVCMSMSTLALTDSALHLSPDPQQIQAEQASPAPYSSLTSTQQTGSPTWILAPMHPQ